MKIYLNPDQSLTDCYLRHVDPLKKSKKYGCIISTKDITPEILAEHEDILLIERMDSAGVWCRDLLKHPHVKTLLKMYCYSDLDLHNRPAIDGRIFIPFDGAEKPQIPELTQEDLAKIKPGFNFFHYRHIEPFVEFAKFAKLKPVQDRNTDLFFAGTIEYDTSSGAGRWITRHRQKCLENITMLGKQGLKVVTAGHRAYTQKEYMAIMADTKVILSPFGWGEFCYRDYEALLLGCRVYKPAFNHIRQCPDICNSLFLSSNFDEFNMLHFEYCLEQNSDNNLLEQKQNEKQIIERILE